MGYESCAMYERSHLIEKPECDMALILDDNLIVDLPLGPGRCKHKAFVVIIYIHRSLLQPYTTRAILWSSLGIACSLHFELFDFTIQLTQRVVEEVNFDGSNDSIEGIMSHKYHTSHPTPIS